MPKTAILIVSYSHDIPYLELNLQSIQKFARGFESVVLVVPKDEKEQFEKFRNQCRIQTYERDKDSVKWHIHAQAQKCKGDLFCPNADYILHTDSDCIFTEPVRPEDYFVEDKPVMVIKPYALIKDSPWKGVTQDALQMTVEYSFMERHPSVYPRDLYESMRSYVESLHKMPFEQFMLSRKPTFPWGISEHNLLGAYGFRFMNPMFHWIEVPKDPLPHEKLRQFWSLSPVDKNQPSPHGEPECTPIEIAQKYLGK